MNKVRGAARGPWLSRPSFFRSAPVRRNRSLGLATLLVASLVPVFLSASASSGPASVWVADQKALLRLDPASNTFVQRVPLAHEVDAVGVDPANGTVWALIDKRLLKWNAAGTQQADIDVKKLGSNFPDPKLLALDPHDGSLWVAGEKGWMHLSPAGQFLAQGKTADDIQAIALDIGAGLWVLTQKQLLRLTPQGALEHAISIKPYLSNPEHLALDPIGGYLWVAGGNTLLRFDLSDLNKSPLSKALSGSDKVDALLAHPLEGTLWVATRNSLLVYDSSATLEKQTPLSGYNLGDLVQLAFDPRSNSLWLAGKKALARFTAEGDFVARLSAEKQIDALGVEPLELVPTVTILNPPDSTLTSNPRPTLRLELGAECNGLPCELVDSYYAGVDLDAKLNNQSVGSLFTRQNRVLSYQPAARLPEGANVLTARVTDAIDRDSGDAASHFTVDTVAPTFASVSPADGTTVSTAQVTIQGQLDDPSANVTLQNASGAVLGLGGASFSFAVTLQSGLNSFTLTAKDPAGNTTSIPYRLTLQTGPVLVPTPINPTVATILADATAFLYSGSNPVQTGVAPGTIEPRRAAVIRGKVLARGGSALPGARITVLNHPEFGSTESRENGEFDLAVNGGGVLTLTFAKAGYLPAQRQVNAPWQDYAHAADVMLVPLDSQATVIDLSSSVPIQVARGSVVTDDDGSRQATVFFPQGTTATLIKPDGSTQTLPTITVRATEYTVGPEGPRSMPATLPPASGYTYAVEISVDEALASGAKKVGGKDVLFNQPVPFYVDNFLNFPVGGRVPVGYYDSDRGVWVPYDNGRVIKILAVAGGLATLDTNGDGVEDTAAQLAALGISDAERAQLAALYPSGKSLWRVALTHFSTWDCNWPYGLPSGARAPNLAGPPGPTCPANNKNGSIIGCQNQTLGETAKVSGTAFSLNYKSDRVPGRINSVPIQLSGQTIPDPVKRIDLETIIAGRRTIQSFPPSPNQSYEFFWDGSDAYGRTIQGEQPLLIRVGYVYDAVYQQPSAQTQSFAQFATTPFSVNRARQQITLWQEMRARAGTWDARNQGLGAWMLDVHHAYDSVARTLYLGNGDKRDAEYEPLIVTRVAGNHLQGFSGDGGQAVNARLYDPMGLTTDTAGNLFIADSVNHRVRKVSPDGVISTVAGNGSASFSGDGGLATAAGMVPFGVAVDSVGSLYILDGGNRRVRKVTPDGTINTVAGNGTSGAGGDGGPATSAQLAGAWSIAVDSAGNLYISVTDQYFGNRVRKVDPNGIITTVAGNGVFGPAADGNPSTTVHLDPQGIAVDSNGTLYIAGTWAHRIYRVTSDGIITTVAGRGPGGINGIGFSGDGGPATAAGLSNPYGVTVDRSGNVWIADTANDRIRRVTPDGIITTVAGIGTNSYSGDNGPAAAAAMNDPVWMTTDTSGNLYFADWHAAVVRKLSPTLSAYTGRDILVPSSDGSEVYYFDAAGRHLRTVHATTGAIRYQFSYDASGYLTAITDGDGNITTIERNGGAPTAIISPYGQRTSLQLDSNGYLASIVNPANEVTMVGYSPSGLLTSFTNPRGYTSTMTYDELGRLTRDQNAASGFWALSRTQSDSRNLEIAVSSALGRTTRYRVENLTTGDERRVNTEPDGRVSDTLVKTNGTTVSTAPDGTVTTSVRGPDPRFGMQSPITRSTSIKLPSGLTSTTTAGRTVALSDPNNYLSLTTQTDTITTNGKVSTSVYTAASRQTVFTTPAGRKLTTLTDAQGRPLQAQIGGLEPLKYSYDARGRVTGITQGSGAETRSSTISYNPQGYTGTLTNSLGEATAFGYDPAGRTTQQLLPDGRVILWSYDANGNIVGLTPPSRPQHGFTYTPVDLESQYDPPPAPGATSPSTQYTYNLDKDLTQISRPDGQIVTLSYDSAGRLVSTTLPHGTLTQTYNAAGQLASLSAAGGVSTSYSYDGSLPVTESMTGPVAGTVSRSYNSDFRITGIGVNGDAVSLAYDNDGLLTQSGALTLTRHAQHGLITATALGGTTTAHSYNGFGELQSFTGSSAGNSLLSFSLGRDARGHIVQKTETVQGQTDGYTYGYDATGRLVSVTKNGSQIAAYGYDGNGNRTSFVTPLANLTGTYDDQDRMLSYGGNTYAYTANGELKTRTQGSETTTYGYDVLGNLRAVNLPDGTNIEYLIDGQNRRIGKKINGSLVQGFLYQDQLRPAAELDGSGNVISRFVYGEKPNVPEYVTKNDVHYRILTDHLGSVRLVVSSATGAVVQRMDYDEFGNVLLDTNPGFQPFGFAGGLYDPQTKLVRFGARDYDAEVGRWTGKDPIRFKGKDVNLYRYTASNPLRYTDVTGLTIYGNWCGPGGSGKPRDAIDACCKTHDGCYEACGADWKDNVFGTKNRARQSRMSDCDKTICDCLNDVDPKDDVQRDAKERFRRYFKCADLPDVRTGINGLQ